MTRREAAPVHQGTSRQTTQAPQQTGLTQAEIREIVLDILG